MPTRGLIQAILEAHAAAPASRGPARTAPLALRPDQVLAGGSAAVVALAAFESLGLDQVRSEVALVGAERVALHESFDSAEHLVALQRAAHRLGAHFARPGDGRCERLQLEHLAAPGRLAVMAGRRAPLAGAVGMLILQAGSIETAAALAGHAHECDWPGLLVCELTGVPGPGVDGHDVALALAARWSPSGPRGRFLEFAGDGVAALPMSARVAIAGRSPSYGAATCLFPSDERTRAWLAALGREADWKSFEAALPIEADERDRVELAVIEPQVAPVERPSGARPVGESSGGEVAAVLIGPGITAPELIRLAAALAGRRIQESVTLIVVPGTRTLRETVAREGALAVLEAAGAEVREGGAPPVAGASGLACGADPVDLPPGRTRWQSAGLATCAAAALTGRLTDPRDTDLRLTEESPAPRAAADDGWRSRESEVGSSSDGARPAFPRGRAFDASLRGEVLVKLGDQVSINDLLPWGPRVRPLVGDLPALASHVLAEKDPGFAERARLRGGGVIVAGENLGCGLSWDSAALATLALGVRAVVARSIAPDYAHALALAGVLPLLFTRPRDVGALEAGDELEIPGLPEALVAGRSLVIRNLTRGFSCVVGHPLGEREIGHLRAGGLLAELRASLATVTSGAKGASAGGTPRAPGL